MKKIIVALLIAAAVLVGCTSKPKVEDKTITVGASPTPHAILLQTAAVELEKEGWTLKVVEYSDYILPNTALQAGDLDANYFQHLPYLEDFNVKNNTTLTSVLEVHSEPLGIYPGKSASLDALDGKTFAIPNDTTNEARALQLLASLGYITLDASKGLEATPRDITSNPYNLLFVELEAATIPRTLVDVDFGIINGNYALSANIGNTVIATEDISSEGASKYENILAVKVGQETSDKTLALIKALSSDAVKQAAKEKFGDLVVVLGK